MSKIVDVVINLDAVHLEDNESIDDITAYLKKRFKMGYEPVWEILYEEIIDD